MILEKGDDLCPGGGVEEGEVAGGVCLVEEGGEGDLFGCAAADAEHFD